MKYSILFFLHFSVCYLFGQDILIQDVHVIPMAEGNLIQLNQNVLIQGDRIARISPAAIDARTQNTTIINCNGEKYLTVGMMDAHSHLPYKQGVEGFGMLEEMKIWKNAGVSNYTILEAATKNGASFFNELDEWGTVEVGKLADLVLLNENPLEDIENISTIESVIIGGKLIDRKSIQAKLEKIESKYQ